MYTNDENSGAVRRGKRRSSILKIPKSPGYILDDIDPNTENVDETVQKSKKARRSSSRRVSFAETCQVKEIPNEVVDKMQPRNSDGFMIDENTPARPSFQDCDNNSDKSSYRQPAQTLAGLPSLLSSPIQESPQKPRFRQGSPERDDGQLELTRSYGAYIQDDRLNTTEPEDMMEMTRNYEGWEFEQSTVLTRQVVSTTCSPERDDGQLELTRTHGTYVQDNRLNETSPQDMMEMTRNYEGWEFEQSTFLTRQVVSSKVSISNQGQSRKLNASRFLKELKGNDARSPKRDGTSFLNKLRTTNATSSCQSQQRDRHNNPSIAEAHSTTDLQPILEGDELEFTQCYGGNIQSSHLLDSSDDEVTINPMEMTRNYEGWQNAQLSHSSTYQSSKTKAVQSPKRDGSLFLNQLKAASKTSTASNTPNSKPQQREKRINPSSVQVTPSNLNHTMHSLEEEGNLDFTQCVGKGIQEARSTTSDDEDVDVDVVSCDEMEMTGNYANWQPEKSREISNQTPMAKNSHSSSHQRSPEKSHDLDFTQCHGGSIETFLNRNVHVDDITANQMEMTRSYENWEKQQQTMIESQRKDTVCHKHSPDEDDNLEFTCCQPGRIETSQSLADDMDVTANQMEMTRDYQNWEHEKSNMVSRKSNTPRNDSNLHQISKRSPEKNESSLDLTRCHYGHIETSQVQAVNMDMTANHMEMTRNYENWEQETSNNVSTTSQTLTIGNNLHPINQVTQKTEEIAKVASNRSEDYLEPTTRDSVPKHVEIPENQTTMVKAVPRATSSKITMDKNFQRFEIKLPTSRIGKFPIYQHEEKSPAIARQSDKNCGNHATSRDDKDATISPTSEQSSHVDIIKENPKNVNDGETPPEVGIDKEQDLESPAVMNISAKSPKAAANDTATNSEQIEAEAESREKEAKTEEKSFEEPYTLREFMSNAGISFPSYATRRSETPMLKCDIPKELKDKIYFRCLSEAKLQIMEDFSQLLQEEIAKNKKLFADKEEQLNANNPPVFRKLKAALGTDNEDLVADVIRQLNRVAQTRGKRLMYSKKKQMRAEILVALQEQEKKLSSDLSLITNHNRELVEDRRVLEKVEADCDKEIEELEATLESEEKEWAKYVKDTDELKQKLEALELELQSKEEQRAQLSSVKESLTSEIAEQRTKKTEMENAIEKLAEEKALRESKSEEIKKFLPFHEALQEWLLVKYNNTELKFTFLGQTLDLDVTFEDAEKINNVQLVSQISEISIPLALLGHRLIMEMFADYDFLKLFPTRNKLPQLLHQVSLACVRVRILLETMEKISINHIVSVNDKILTVEFSSLVKFMKFILNIDLSKLVTDGDIAFTVVKKIGNTSAEAITKQLNQFPSTIVYLLKILETADELMR